MVKDSVQLDKNGSKAIKRRVTKYKGIFGLTVFQKNRNKGNKNTNGIIKEPKNIFIFLGKLYLIKLRDKMITAMLGKFEDLLIQESLNYMRTRLNNIKIAIETGQDIEQCWHLDEPFRQYPYYFQLGDIKQENLKAVNCETFWEKCLKDLLSSKKLYCILECNQPTQKLLLEQLCFSHETMHIFYRNFMHFQTDLFADSLYNACKKFSKSKLRIFRDIGRMRLSMDKLFYYIQICLYNSIMMFPATLVELRKFSWSEEKQEFFFDVNYKKSNVTEFGRPLFLKNNSINTKLFTKDSRNKKEFNSFVNHVFCLINTENRPRKRNLTVKFKKIYYATIQRMIYHFHIDSTVIENNLVYLSRKEHQRFVVGLKNFVDCNGKPFIINLEKLQKQDNIDDF